MLHFFFPTRTSSEGILLVGLPANVNPLADSCDRSPAPKLQACQEDIFISSLWNVIQPFIEYSASFCCRQENSGFRRERAFMLLLTAVRDITQALDAFCVLLNQLTEPLVSWKKKTTCDDFFFFLTVLLANSCSSWLIFLSLQRHYTCPCELWLCFNPQ